MNTFKTAMLMALLTALMVVAGGALGGHNGAKIMLAFSIIVNFVTYWNSDTLILKSYHAQEITRSQAPELYGLIEKLAKKAELPMPKVCIIRSEVPNAFATGRNPSHAAVCVTTGIMRALDYNEIAGVLAHELSHVKHYDTLIATVAASFAGVISMLAEIAKWGMIFGMGGRDRDGDSNPLAAIVAIVVAPLAAMLIQMAISRSREYDADKSGGELCGDPLYLASALEKLDFHAKHYRPLDGATTSTAHLFIVNPLSKANISFKSLFSTHPSTEERVERLREQAKSDQKKND